MRGPDIPSPWEASKLTSFFHAHSATLHAIFKKQRSALQLRLMRMRSNGTDPQQLFQALVAAGLITSSVGLDFTPLQKQLYSQNPTSVLHDRRVQQALDLLVFPVDQQLEGTSAVARTCWANDQPNRRHVLTPSGSDILTHRADSPGMGLLRQLHAEGFASVRDWRHFGLDLPALSLQVDNALRNARNKGSCCKSSRAPLPALATLLNSSRLAKLLRGYLGGSVRYDGHVVLKLTENVTMSNYASSLWHHDRCGRRIKLFIFLHDVDISTRPTLVAARSHNVLYYTFAEPWNLLSRYSDSWVNSQYRVVPMTGETGGGFLFDTNSLHRGLVDGNQTRTTVILEFHAHGKVRPILNFRNPCPSIKADKRARKAAPGKWQDGVPGFALFPTENGIGKP